FGNAFHTISTVNESPIDENVLWAGTTDGNVWSSNDYGSNWNNVTGNLPDRYVTSVKPSPLKPNTAFVAHSGYKYNDFFPHIHRTDDLGQTWTDISGDLPNLAINDIFVYPDDDLILFIATDGGVYYTLDGGLDWERIGDNMPMIPVYDLEIELIPGNEVLVAATFARSIMTIELAALFPPIAPTVTYNGDLTFCEGDSMVLQAPVGFDGYLWNTGDTTQSIVVDESGVYQVSVFNSYGLSSPFSDSVAVIVSPYPEAPILSASSQLCQGESIVINGPAGFNNYYWSNGVQGVDSIVVSQAGSYSLLVENTGGCSSPLSEWLQLEVTPLPVAGFLAEPQFSTEVMFTNQSQDGLSYAWDFGDGNVSTDENPVHNYAASGGYEVQMIVTNDCGSDTSYQTVNVAISSLEASWIQSLEIFPNPVSDQFEIRGEGLNNTEVKVSLMDLSGKQIWQNEISTNGGTLLHAAAVQNLVSGVYVLRVQQGEIFATRKITVQR
ncbi:MAG: PKD domain-containing protein, partial [Bacteroidota bacterium]